LGVAGEAHLFRHLLCHLKLFGLTGVGAAGAGVTVFTAHCLKSWRQGEELIRAQGKDRAGGNMAGQACQIERLFLVHQGLIGPGVTRFLPEAALSRMTTLAALMTNQGKLHLFADPVGVQVVNLLFDPGDDGRDFGCLGQGSLQGQKVMVEAAGSFLLAGKAGGQTLFNGLNLSGHRFPILLNQLDLVKVLRLLKIFSFPHPQELPVEGAKPVAQLGQFFSFYLFPSAAFMPVNTENALILSLGCCLGNQGIVDLLRDHVAALPASCKDEVERGELPGYFLIFGRREAGEQDQDITLGSDFFNQGRKHHPPVCQGDAWRQGGNSTGQANNPGFYLADFFDVQRLKQWQALLVKEIGGQPGESLLLTAGQQRQARGQIEWTNRDSVHLHGAVNPDDSFCRQELLRWPVCYPRLLEEQIAGVNKEIGLLLFGGDIPDLECFSGQPAQLTGASAAGLGLSLDIV